jgi:hypothetical protein
MSSTVELIGEFVAYARMLKGDEKGEAQVFCDRLFQAFGHGGYQAAEASASAITVWQWRAASAKSPDSQRSTTMRQASSNRGAAAINLMLALNVAKSVPLQPTTCRSSSCSCC